MHSPGQCSRVRPSSRGAWAYLARSRTPITHTTTTCLDLLHDDDGLASSWAVRENTLLVGCGKLCKRVSHPGRAFPFPLLRVSRLSLDQISIGTGTDSHRFTSRGEGHSLVQDRRRRAVTLSSSG